MKKLFSVLFLLFLFHQISCLHLGDPIKQSSTVSMSRTYRTYGPQLAVDGKYPNETFEETPEGCNCCSIADGFGKLWWTIDFGNSLIIEGITLTGRKDSKERYQSRDLMIYGSNTSVTQTDGRFGDLVWYINTSTPGYIFRHTFQPPRQFRYLSITRSATLKHYMTICEVDFTAGCLPGHYGTNCSETCGNCQNAAICLATNGVCPYGCAPGYDATDKTCKTKCSPGQYGADCSERCGNCNVGISCKPADGICLTGCTSGYDYTADIRCKTACKPGHYGNNCAGTCGHCIGGTTVCSVINGTCPAGCVQGYNATDHTCKTACKPGHYGNNCAGTCGHCIGGTTVCSVITGACPAGCAHGFNATDHTCKTVCISGHYGFNCTETCGQCYNGTLCSISSGQCPAGCSPGFDYIANATCKQACHKGFYGLNCSDTCGNCINETACLVSDGTCPAGCAPGYTYTDKTCKTECQPGQYGVKCSESCGNCIHRKSNCLITDGTCPTGCAPGYSYIADKTCKTKCQDGSYGLHCSEMCGHCVHGATTCLVIDGTCPSGCETGYNPADRTCKTGVNILRATGFSVNTSQSSQYLDSDSSRAIDGLKGLDPETCNCCSQTQNAEVSWWQVDMGVVLPIGEIVVYGQNDNRYQQFSLSGFSVYLSTSVSFSDVPFVKEQDTFVNVTYIIDVHGNFARYIRIQRIGVLIICEVEIFLSDKTCPPNTYTVYCIPCGHCYAGLPCDDITGRCPNGCETGYSGDTCKQAISTGTSYGTKDVIGAAIGGTIGGAILIFLIGMLVHSRNKLRCPWVCRTSQDYESPKPIKNAADQNMYDILDIPDVPDQSISGNMQLTEEVNPATPRYQNTNI